MSFTDAAGNQESLTSTAAALPTLTVRLTVAAPTTHDGTTVFTFEIEVSEEVRLSYRTLRDHAFVV